MKATGVSYAIGRDGRARYGESWSGRREILPGNHQLVTGVPALDGAGRLLPYVRPYAGVAAIGEGDGRIQAYCYRLCLTRDPANRLPIPRPELFDPARFALVYGYLKALGERATLGHFLGISEMSNRKTDINAGGGVSTNLPGASWEYPEASPARRAEIAREHLDWAHGLVWNPRQRPGRAGEGARADARVRPRPRRVPRHGPLAASDVRPRGPADAWRARAHAARSRARPQQVRPRRHGRYNIDIREIQWLAVPVPRFPSMQAEVLQEGYLSVPVEPYEIPYRSLLPRSGECSNLRPTWRTRRSAWSRST